ncbi:MAG: alkaline phosphatase [Porticoccaceae bacterium]|nr:alkaline phosphatase [Porticoccaceae bacterium]MBT7375000.1 alkaline phosphatase [Porticoccaceae bacterium]
MNRSLSARLLSLILLSLLFLLGCSGEERAVPSAQPDLVGQRDNSWYRLSAAQIADANNAFRSINTNAGAAKNIILFIGDGMSLSTVTAARILEGQQKGMSGEENSLSFGRFPFTGLAKTYNVDAQTPDSAGTMTAIISGVKTDIGVIGVDENVIEGDCSSMAGNTLVTALELAEIAGLSTGIISTARITHATPAATYAKAASRDWEDNAKMPAVAIEQGCEDIASQLVNFEDNLEAQYSNLDIDGIDLVMGGGRRHFLPADAAFNSADAASAVEGDRTDGRNLIAEWQASYPSGRYIEDQQGFDALQTEESGPVLGLFNESHMRYEADRSNDIAGEPSLTQMTQKAIDILDNNDRGFFLMVESGRIDHGHHASSAYNALTDTIEFSNAIQAAVDSTNPSETLIIVTADHGHVFTIAGYPKRGNPMLGKVIYPGADKYALAADGMPYTTLGYANGPGFHDFSAQANEQGLHSLGSVTDADTVYGAELFMGRADLSAVDTQSSGFHQESSVPMRSETHSGEDVPVYARGPGAHLVSGTQEQSGIFHVMNYAGNLVVKVKAAQQ